MLNKEEPTYVKSVYAYDGLDEHELSFPSECYIRLLRKNIVDRGKDDGEEWWEGAYENKIGFFPAIFVLEFGKFDRSSAVVNEHDVDDGNDDESERTLELENTCAKNEDSLKAEMEKANMLSPENQQVPQ